MERLKKKDVENIRKKGKKVIYKTLFGRPYPLKLLISEFVKNTKLNIPKYLIKNGNKFRQFFLDNDDCITSINLNSKEEKEKNKEFLKKVFGIPWEYDKDTKNPYRSYYFLLEDKRFRTKWGEKLNHYLKRKNEILCGVMTLNELKKKNPEAYKKYLIKEEKAKEERKKYNYCLSGSLFLQNKNTGRKKRVFSGNDLKIWKDNVKGRIIYFLGKKENGKWRGMELDKEIINLTFPKHK